MPSLKPVGIGVGDATDVESTDSGSAISILKRLRTLLGGTGSVRITDGTDIALVTSAGGLHVNLRDNAGAEVSVGGGTQYDEDTPHVTADKLTLAGVLQQTADAAVSGDGDRSLMQVDASGWLKVNVKAGSAGGVSHTDDAAFTPAVDDVVPAAGVFDDTLPDSVDEGDAGAVRMSANRNLYVRVRDNAGNERGLNVDASGRALVDASGVAVPVTDNGTTLSVDDGAGSLTVDGTVSVSGAVDTELTTADLDTGVGADTRAVVGLVRAESGGGLLVGSANPLPVIGAANSGVDIGDVTINNAAGASAVNVQDGGNSLTVDGSVGITGAVDTELPAAAALADNMANPTAPAVGAHGLLWDGVTWDRAVNGGGTEAAALRVTLANDSTGLVSIDDNGGSLTVDGSVSITGAVDTELPAAAALADAAANPTTPTVGGANLIFNGTTWDRARGDIANGLDVDVTRLPALVAGSANIGDVDVLTMPVDANAAEVQGTIAHGVADGQNPVKIGGKANLNEPAVVADGQRVDAWFDLLGRLVTVSGHPNPEPPVTANGSAAGLSVIAAPGASLSLYIRKGSIHNAGVEQLVSLRDGAAGTIRWTANVAADGGGSLFDFGERGWKLTANTALVADIAAATVYVNVSDYYIAA